MFSLSAAALLFATFTFTSTFALPLRCLYCMMSQDGEVPMPEGGDAPAAADDLAAEAGAGAAQGML